MFPHIVRRPAQHTYHENTALLASDQSQRRTTGNQHTRVIALGDPDQVTPQHSPGADPGDTAGGEGRGSDRAVLGILWTADTSRPPPTTPSPSSTLQFQESSAGAPPPPPAGREALHQPVGTTLCHLAVMTQTEPAVTAPGRRRCVRGNETQSRAVTQAASAKNECTVFCVIRIEYDVN